MSVERTPARHPTIGALALVMGQNDPAKFGGKPPLACCPDCGEPLVATTQFRGYEFICAGGCGRLWGFVDPVPKAETDDLRERADRYQREFDEGVKRAEPDCTACRIVRRSSGPGFYCSSHAKRCPACRAAAQVGGSCAVHG